MQVDLKPPSFDVGREWDNAVAEWAHKNLFRVDRADKRDVDVTAAFKTFGQANVLDTASGVGLEPAVSVHFLALDRDKAAAGVGRRDADRDLFSGPVLLSVQFDFELGILFQRAGSSALADYRKM